MRRLLILAAALSAPSLAQHQGHHMPGHAMPAAKPRPAAKPPARKVAPKAKPAARPVRKAKERSGIGKSTPNPYARHDMADEPARPTDPHAGHDMEQGANPSDDAHAGHDMSASAEAPAPPAAPPPPGAFSGPAHAADLVYPPSEMAAGRARLREEHGGMRTYKVLVDRLEVRARDGRDSYVWDADAWYGGDTDRLWLKSEGEGKFRGSVEQAEAQALWSHAINPWFDLQAGLRYDVRPGPERAHFVLGVQGLAPYWFEVEAAAFLSDKGDLTARFEADYNLRLTQRLILQPRIELDLAARDAPEIGVGSGLSAAGLGARFRYEIRPQFAPYIGIEHERAFGDTAAFRRAAGEDRGGWSLLAGVRAWF